MQKEFYFSRASRIEREDIFWYFPFDFLDYAVFSFNYTQNHLTSRWIRIKLISLEAYGVLLAHVTCLYYS